MFRLNLVLHFSAIPRLDIVADAREGFVVI